MSRQIIIPVFLLLLLCELQVFGQPQNSFIRDSLDNYITNAMKLWNIPGVAVAIVKDDAVVYAKGFGTTDLSGRTKVNSATLFPIWSMGKSFTAFSLALLEDRKQLKLEDKVKTYDPQFAMSDKAYENEMNLIDLLSHRMGVETFQGDFLWSESALSNEELLRRWSKFKPAHPIRSGFQYSNFGYLIAGNVIERVSKKSWQTFTTDEILKPLGMTNSLLLIDEVKSGSNIAHGHTKLDGKIIPLAAGESMKIEAFGGMYSNVEDMALWLRLHLNKGAIGGAKLFSERIFERVHKPQNIIGKMFLPDGSSPHVNYALGWEVRDYQGKEVITHGGAYAGFISMMGFVPQEKLGFVILTNSDANELGEALKWQVIDAYSQRDYRNYATGMHGYTLGAEEWEAKGVKTMTDSVALNIPTEIPLKSFTGEYDSPFYGKIQVRAEGSDVLKLKFEHHPQLDATLQHIGNNRFWCRYSQAMFGKVVIPFKVTNGKAKSFELSVHPYVEFTTYHFTKVR